MIRFLRHSWLSVLLSTGAAAHAACTEESERFRGAHQIPTGAQASVLLRVQQHAEDLLLDVVDSRGKSVRYAHPAGANIDHVILLENATVSGDLTLCLTARFAQGRRGRAEVSMESVTPSDSDRARLITEAAANWGEATSESRARALTIYQQLATQEAVQNDVGAVQTALFEGLALMRRSSYQQALSRLTAVSRQSVSEPVLQYKLQWNLGRTYLRLGRHEEAILSFKAAMSSIESFGNIARQNIVMTAADLAEIRIELAEAYLAQGDRDLAQAQIALAEDIAETDYRLMGKLYDVLGYLAIVNSQQPSLPVEEQREALADAIDVMLTGRFFSQSAGDAITQAAFENNLGFAYDQLGEFHRAFQHYRQILDMVTPDEDPLVYRYAYSNLGKLYQYTADYPRSASYYRQAIELAESSSGTTSMTRCALGTTLRLNGDISAALSEHELCLLEAERGNRSAVLALARLELGEDYLALGDEDRAWQYTRLAWQQGEDGVAAAIRTRILRRYAWFLQQQGQSQAASEMLDNLLSEHERQRFIRVDEIDNLAMAMQVASDQGNNDQAISFGLQAVALIEQQYEQLESARLGASWSGRAHEVFVQLAGLYLHDYMISGDEQSLTSAFNMTERSRAISLRQQFAIQRASQGIAATASLTRSVVEQAQIAMISQIANAHALNTAVNVDDVRLPVSYYQHQDVLSLYRLQDMEQLPLPDALQKENLQARLSPDQVVLYYLMTADDVYVFTLTPTSLEVERLAARSEIDPLLEASRLSLANPNSAPYAQLAQLSALLMPESEAYQAGSELIIVPHGRLHALPFAALPLPGRSSYEPLVSRFSVSSVPSLTAWTMDKPASATVNNTDIAIFADPVFDANQLEQDLAYRDVDSTRAYSWTRSLERLEATALEARNITRQFPENRAVLLTGVQASRRQLARQDVRNARVLHIATHGYFNEASDDNVGLGFSVIDENGEPDSGFVTLAELFSYEFNNQLVVISGCDTSMGRNLAGEGMMGIARGFVSQGAQHVIATLWPVSDRASAEFMSIFYEQLLQLGHVGNALQATQQAFQSNPNYRDPYYWAAYVLTSVSPDQTLDFPEPQLAQLGDFSQ